MSGALQELPQLQSESLDRSSSPFAPLLERGQNVLWSKRSLTPAVAKAMDEVAEGEGFRNKTTLDLAHLDLRELLEPVSHSVARVFLKSDITSIVRDFATAFGLRHVDAQLEVVTGDACRKFHTDFVTVRLLCTYAGPGTEWLKNEDVLRKNMGRADADIERANRSVLRDGAVVQHCGAGDLLVLKGEAYDGNRGFGAVHRSPPVVDKALRRLVFKIDASRCGC